MGNLFCRVSSPYLRRLSYFNHRTEMFGSRQKPLEGPESFAPKVPVLLDAPKDDPITYEELSKCGGADPSKPILIAIKGTVFDVSRNRAYQPEGPYCGTPTIFSTCPSLRNYARSNESRVRSDIEATLI